MLTWRYIGHCLPKVLSGNLSQNMQNTPSVHLPFSADCENEAILGLSTRARMCARRLRTRPNAHTSARHMLSHTVRKMQSHTKECCMAMCISHERFPPGKCSCARGTLRGSSRNRSAVPFGATCRTQPSGKPLHPGPTTTLGQRDQKPQPLVFASRAGMQFEFSVQLQAR